MSDMPASLITPPDGYNDWLAELKQRIHGAQQRATLAVNRELILLYWQVGREGDRAVGLGSTSGFSGNKGVLTS